MCPHIRGRCHAIGQSPRRPHTSGRSLTFHRCSTVRHTAADGASGHGTNRARGHPDGRSSSEASPLTAEVQLTLGAEVCGRGQHKYAAPCAGSRFTRLAPSLCCPDRPHCAEIPTHQSQAGRPTRHGCLMHQGLEQDVVQNPGSTNAATTSTKTQDQRPSLEHKGSLERARTTLTLTSGDARSATRKVLAGLARCTGSSALSEPFRPPGKLSRNGYKPPLCRSSPKPLPQKENPSSNPSGHPHSCREPPKIAHGVFDPRRGRARCGISEVSRSSTTSKVLWHICGTQE
jgi:hypothetical protein